MKKHTKQAIMKLGEQGFFSKFLMGDSKFSVPVGPQRGRSWMGGGTYEKKSDWSQTCPPNAKLGHFLLF